MSDVHIPQDRDELSGINLLIPLPFRVSLIITCGIWAWGLNFYYLSALRIDLPSLIKYTAGRNNAQPPHFQRIYRLAWAVTVAQVVFLVLFVLFTRGNRESVVNWDIIPVLSLSLIVLLFVLPLQRLSKTGRYRFLSTLKRISVGGLAETQDGKFGDILLADALTSYARVLGDLVASLCMFFTPGISATGPPDRSCGGEIAIPLVISIPSMIRLRQCLIEYYRVRNNPTRASGWGGQHLANALKYSTAFPVILLTAMQRNLTESENSTSGRMLWISWIVAALVNSIYSFYWDIAKDWDLTIFSSARHDSNYPWGLRRKRHFHSDFLYYAAILFDLLLRFTWVTRITPRLEGMHHLESGIFMLQVLEVFRRWIWIFFRVETEWVRSQADNEDVIVLGEFDQTPFQD